MSREAEARSGVLGPAAWREAHGQGGGAVGLPTWPMTPEQLAFAQSIDVERHPWWLHLAERLRDLEAKGRFRYSMSETDGGNMVYSLIHHGILRRHEYASGAWQCVSTPFTRSWYLFLLTRPKDTACPSSPSTPRPAASIPASTPS